MSKSDLPFGSEFSPSIIDLPRALEIAKANQGSKDALDEQFKLAFFEQNATDDSNKRKLAMNLRLSMKAYLLLDDDYTMTEFGNHLYDVRADPDVLYRDLAKHILLKLYGVTLLQCVQDMTLAGEPTTLVAIRRNLGERGLHFPRGGKHASMLRLWLEKAGVIKRAWRIDQAKLDEMLGASSAELEVLAQLTPAQRAFLKALGSIGDGQPQLSNELEKLAAATYGAVFNEKLLPKTVLYPLRDAGYIELERGTKKPGPGAKPFIVTPTEKFNSEVLVPLIEQFEQQVHSDLRPLLRKPLSTIIDELEHESTHIKGLALEALALKLMRMIDLGYVGTRLRGSATGGAEVDVLFESDRLIFTRWQVQCKNCPSVSLDDVAKEVGLTHTLKSNAIVVVGTGKIGPAARKYARKVMQDSNLAIVLMDGEDIEYVAQNPPGIIDVLNREARQAMKLKKLDLDAE